MTYDLVIQLIAVVLMAAAVTVIIWRMNRE